MGFRFLRIQNEKQSGCRAYLWVDVIINKMYAFKKEGDQLVKKIKDDKETLVFGISFCRPPSVLVLYKQHLYSLYLLLYKYGETHHRKKFMNKINKYLTELSIKVDRHSHKCIPSDLRLECIENKKIIGLLQIFNFAKEDLQDEKKQTVFHSQKERKKLRKILKYIFEQEGKPFERQFMNLFDYAKIAGSLLGLDCEIREFFNFQLVQFKCEIFDDRRLEVFIEIDRVSNTYRYVKQRKLDLDCNNDQDCQKIAASAMKYSLFSTDAYNNMRYLESQTEGIEQLNNLEEVEEFVESVCAVSKECSMQLQESAMAEEEEQEQEVMLQSNVLVSRKSNQHSKYNKGYQFAQIDKSSVQDCHQQKQEEIDLLQSVAQLILGQHKSSKSNALAISQNSKQEMFEEESFTERFDVEKQLQKMQAPSTEHLKLNRIRKLSDPQPLAVRADFDEGCIFKIVVSKVDHQTKKQKQKEKDKEKIMASSKGSKLSSEKKQKEKKVEEFQNSYVVKRQFLDELFQDDIEPEKFIIALHQQFTPKIEKTSSVIEEKLEKVAEKPKQPQKQQNLLSTKESKKPSQPCVKKQQKQKEALPESLKTVVKQTINFKKNRKNPLTNSKSIEKSKELNELKSRLMLKTQSVVENQQPTSQNLKNEGNPQKIPKLEETKCQSKEIIRSTSPGNVIRLSSQKNIIHAYKYSSRMTVHRESSLTKPEHSNQQVVVSK